MGDWKDEEVYGYPDEECFQCGGTGYVNRCPWEWQCGVWSDGEQCCLGEWPCDVCNSKPPDPQLSRGLGDALQQAQEQTP